MKRKPEATVPVTIVRPKREWPDVLGEFLAGAGGLFLRAWLLMLLLPPALGWHVSYWRAMTLVIAVSVLINHPTSWTRWTRGPKR